MPLYIVHLLKTVSWSLYGTVTVPGGMCWQQTFCDVFAIEVFHLVKATCLSIATPDRIRQVAGANKVNYDANVNSRQCYGAKSTVCQMVHLSSPVMFLIKNTFFSFGDAL